MVYWYSPFLPLPKLERLERPAGVKGRPLCRQICAFDIETTRLPNDNAVMYIWQFAIDEDFVVLGRTWDSFRDFIRRLSKQAGKNTLLCFVHNLSHEAQFLIGQFRLHNDDFLAMDSRKILFMRLAWNIELRCSYLLTNLSLAALTSRYKVQYAKQSGAAFDYSKIRLADTPLTHRELFYCVCDVVGLVECVKAINKLHGDSLYTMPYTQTGYLRRELRKAAQHYRPVIENCWSSLLVYYVLRRAFRGGSTHANRFFTGEIIENVQSYDICSEYPAQILCRKFPMRPFKEIPQPTPAVVEDLMENGYAVLMVVRLSNLSLKNMWWPVPYLSKSKCWDRVDIREDNGRILEGSCTTAITDLDYKIIREEYNCDILILEAWSSRYGMLPKELRDVVLYFYKEKTRLKNVDGQELYYQRAKELANASFGCMSMDPLTPDIDVFDANGRPYWYMPSTKHTDEELLEAAKKNAPVLYQWGVWVTAWARTELEQLIKTTVDQLGVDGFLYCDTDSNKTTGKVDFSAINDEWHRLSDAAGATAPDDNGIYHPIGVVEDEAAGPDDIAYRRFVTLGAKKYAYERWNKKHKRYELGVTIAGLPKQKGAQILQQLGGLEAMARVGQVDGAALEFVNCGKLESVYNDGMTFYNLDGREITCYPNVCLRPVNYTLSITDDYRALLNLSAKDLYFFRKNLYI